MPGSLVFRMPPGPVPLDDVRNWWPWVPGADWRHPEGPGSTLDGRDRHPVTHVACADAVAYAAWAGKALPTEAEWERAARGGLEGAVFTWGDEFAPRRSDDGQHLAGPVPVGEPATTATPAPRRSSSFPPNGYGLYDMAGNVWEWTDDFYAPATRPTRRRSDAAPRPCCAPHNPRVAAAGRSYATGRPGEHFARRVIKGGSHLCAPELLPALPPGGPAGRDDGDLDQPHRLPLHRPTG